MSNIITAEAARESSNKAEHLIDLISTNIKEASEMGANEINFIFDNLCPSACEKIKSTFENNGFNCEIVCNEFPFNPGQTDHIRRDYTIIISW